MDERLQDVVSSRGSQSVCSSVWGWNSAWEIMSIWGPISSGPKTFTGTIGLEADGKNQTAQ